MSLRLRNKRRWWQFWLIYVCDCESWYTGELVLNVSLDEPSDIGGPYCHGWGCGWTTAREAWDHVQEHGGELDWRTVE